MKIFACWPLDKKPDVPSKESECQKCHRPIWLPDDHAEAGAVMCRACAVGMVQADRSSKVWVDGLGKETDTYDEAMVCWRTADLIVPRDDAVRSQCSVCQHQVWVQRRNLDLGMTLFCRPCAFKEMNTTNETLVIRPATEAHK